MKFFNVTSLFAVLFFSFLLLGNAAAYQNKQFNFETMLDVLEEKLPIVEKQSAILLQMLSKENHLQMIKNDFNNENIKRAEQTYLFKVFQKLEIPLKESYIHKIVIAPISCDKFEYLSLHDPYTIAYIATGHFRNEYKPEDTEKYTYRLKSIIEKYFSVIVSVQNQAKKTLPDENRQGHMIIRITDFSKFDSQVSKFEVYAFLPTEKKYDSYGLRDDVGYFTQNFAQLERQLSNYPVDYINFLSNTSEKCEHAGFMNKFTVNYSDFRNNLKQLIEMKAKIDISDLSIDSSSTETKEDHKSSDAPIDGSLSIDDLQLPE